MSLYDIRLGVSRGNICAYCLFSIKMDGKVIQSFQGRRSP